MYLKISQVYTDKTPYQPLSAEDITNFMYKRILGTVTSWLAVYTQWTEYNACTVCM